MAIQGFLAALGGYSQGAVEQKRYNQQLKAQQDQQEWYRKQQEDANKDLEYNRLTQSIDRIMKLYSGAKNQSQAAAIAKSYLPIISPMMKRANEIQGVTAPIDEANIFPEFQADYSTSVPYLINLMRDKFTGNPQGELMMMDFATQVSEGKLSPNQAVKMLMELTKQNQPIAGSMSGGAPSIPSVVPPTPTPSLATGMYGPPLPTAGMALAPQMDAQPSLTPDANAPQITYNPEGNVVAANNAALAPGRASSANLADTRAGDIEATQESRINLNTAKAEAARVGQETNKFRAQTDKWYKQAMVQVARARVALSAAKAAAGSGGNGGSGSSSGGKARAKGLLTQNNFFSNLRQLTKERAKQEEVLRGKLKMRNMIGGDSTWGKSYDADITAITATLDNYDKQIKQISDTYYNVFPEERNRTTKPPPATRTGSPAKNKGSNRTIQTRGTF